MTSVLYSVGLLKSGIDWESRPIKNQAYWQYFFALIHVKLPSSPQVSHQCARCFQFEIAMDLDYATAVLGSHHIGACGTCFQPSHQYSPSPWSRLSPFH